MLVIKTAPTIEPITLAQAKEHLRLDSDSFDDNLSSTQCLSYGSKTIADNYTTYVGTGVSVVGKRAEVLLHCGTNGATGTNDTRIEESDDNINFLPWSGGDFTQVTTDNDNADYKMEYTGTKTYIRTASKVLLAACEFGTSVLTYDADSSEDDLLTALIQAAREHIEDITRRALLTQHWYFYLDEFPEDNFIRLPFGNLQSVTSIKYKDSDGTETTMTVDTDYLVETNGEDYGRIVLPYGESWPSFTAYPSNPIIIEFVCGWTAAASIPAKIVAALKLILTDLFTNREGRILSSFDYKQNPAVMALLSSARLWREF